LNGSSCTENVEKEVVAVVAENEVVAVPVMVAEQVPVAGMVAVLVAEAGVS
jgi:hypothetical protein